MNIKKNAAFTLIELLVVVLIVGILAAVALPQYEKAVARSRVSQGLVWMNAVITAQEIYKMANGEYSDNLDDIGAGLPQGHTCFMFKLVEALCRVDIGRDKKVYISYVFPSGKLYCRTLAERDGFGDEVCKTFGVLDAEMSNDANNANYYVINR